MKAFVQRVSEASVAIDGKCVSEIGAGLLILLGVTHTDGLEDVARLAHKIPALRIFQDSQGLMNQSILDIDGSVLVISQFSLYADTRKGNRPSFIAAAKAEHAEPLYNELLCQLRLILGTNRVGAGVFGATMQVRLLNDGPVSLELTTEHALKTKL